MSFLRYSAKNCEIICKIEKKTRYLTQTDLMSCNPTRFLKKKNPECQTIQCTGELRYLELGYVEFMRNLAFVE